MRGHKNWLTEEKAIEKLGTDKTDLDALVAGEHVKAIIDGDKGFYVYDPKDIEEVLEDRLLTTEVEGSENELQGLDFGDGLDESLSLGAGESSPEAVPETAVPKKEEESSSHLGLTVFVLILGITSLFLNVVLSVRVSELEAVVFMQNAPKVVVPTKPRAIPLAPRQILPPNKK